MKLLRIAAVALGLTLLAGCSLVTRRTAPVAPQTAAEPGPVAPLSPLPIPSLVPPPPANLDSIPDAVPRFEPRSKRGNPPFYDVLGHRYFVLPSGEGYVERGVASWYGPTFHGVSTAVGEPYDMYAMTAAHKTLPLPAYARVTNLRNGKSVVVRINDRGPFVANRIIDLSYTAAARLDMLRDGTSLVEVRVLLPDQPDTLTRASQSPSPELYVQAGAFSDQGNAQHLLERLHAAGLTGAFVRPPAAGKDHLFRVRLGPVASVAYFDQLAARLAAIGVPEARLALD